MKETALALTLSMLSFMLAIIWGGPLLRILRHFKIGKLIRLEGPESHMSKDGHAHHGRRHVHFTRRLSNRPFECCFVVRVGCSWNSVLLPVLAMIGFALLGAIDDWEGIRGPRRGLGMRARTKFLFQIIFAIAIAIVLQYKYLFDVPEMYWPTYNEPISLGALVHPDRHVHHCRHVQCSQFY